MTNKHLNFSLPKTEPLMIVLSGLSGTGKDALIHALLKRKMPLEFIVTTTSRLPRRGEVDGVDYHFVSRNIFEAMIANNELIEYARVYEDFKGPQKKHVLKALKSGKDVILRLDVQGAARIKQINPDALLIFLTPQTETEWLNRLKKRGTESPESLRIRRETAEKEMETLSIFDYVVINPDGKLQQAVNSVEAIILAEHLRVQPRKIHL